MSTEVAPRPAGQSRQADARTTTTRPNIARRWATGAAGVFITAYYALTMRALDAFGLHNDLGIQYYLARITADGAVPLIDFEHGWNTLSWYYSALLYRLADGNATVWVNLWGRGGFIMAGLAMLVVAWRARLPAAWIAGLTATWIVLTHVPHNKYAIPTIWVATILPAQDRRPRSWQRALRVGLAATVFWAHVELAVLLAIGTAMYDLLGVRDDTIRERLVTATHAPLGVAVGLASQVAVYAGLGVAPPDFLTQAIGNWTVTDFGPLFNFPVAAPDTLRLALFPMLMLVPFVPLLWRHLSDPTRLIALCNLALGLIAIRRPGDGHAAAAGTLAALVVVLGAYDLAMAKENLRATWARVEWRTPAALALGLGGAVWYAAGLYAGFEVASLAAIVGLTVVSLTGVVAARVDQMTSASVGALALAVVVALGGAGNHLVQIARADDAQLETTLIAAAVGDDLASCTAGSADPSSVWVVDSPLTLYDALDVVNPTPFFAFWYNLEGERDRIIDLMDAGTIPTILQVGSWPESLQSTVPQIQDRYEECATVVVERTGQPVTVWTLAGG